MLIEFPVSVNEVKMSGKVNIRNATQDNFVFSDYTSLEGIEQISCKEIYARHHHAMFVGIDEQIMGLGYRAAGKGEGMHKLRLIERPEACSGYKRAGAGKFFRFILTEEGRIFFSGQNKKYMVGKDVDTNAYVDKFYEIENLYPLEAGDKLIDLDGGKHFMIAVSEKGKVYTSGYMMYRVVAPIRHNSQGDEDYPCELRMPEGWKAIRGWACDLYTNVWVLAVKADDPSVF